VPSTGTVDLLPAQYDEGVLIAHPAKVMRFLGVSLMVQRSTIDNKVLVTIDGDDRDIRIILNDGHVFDGPDTTPARPAPQSHGNIADSPTGIAAHLASPQSATFDNGRRVSQLHLRDVGDGYWTRVRLVTVREHGWFESHLTLDHHRTPPHGQEDARAVEGATFPVRSVAAPSAFTTRQLAAAHASAAAILVAYPEAIAHLLERTTKP
jgi:hypothetical protein